MAPSTHPLRERLAELLRENWIIDRLGTSEPEDEAAEELLPVIAEYLREQAANLREIPDDHGSTGRSVRLIKAEALASAADSISPEATP